MKIRPATSGDYQEVIKLYGDLVDDQKRFANLDNDSYQKFITDPNSYLEVATEEDKIVGFITYSVRTVVRYPSPIVEVEEFYVKPEYRRQGIGKKLMQRVTDFAKSHNYPYVFLASAKRHEMAHKFYKATEFDEYGLHFRKKP